MNERQKIIEQALIEAIKGINEDLIHVDTTEITAAMAKIIYKLNTD